MRLFLAKSQRQEDIDDLVLLDVVKVPRLSHASDVPCIAGYSSDGKTVA
jgi:hypothetical protein